jgi:hypothetical protein
MPHVRTLQGAFLALWQPSTAHGMMDSVFHFDKSAIPRTPDKIAAAFSLSNFWGRIALAPLVKRHPGAQRPHEVRLNFTAPLAVHFVIAPASHQEKSFLR